MKVFLKDLANIADEKVYPVDFKCIEVNDNMFLRRIENVTGDITFYYSDDDLRINYEIEGTMICPCAITLQDVEVPFDLSEDDNVVRDPELEGFFLDTSMELADLIKYIVIPEAPIKVVKNEKIEYSRGDGWSFVSEENDKSLRENQIDPRLQKLREIKIEED